MASSPPTTTAAGPRWRAGVMRILGSGKPVYRGTVLRYRRRCGAAGCKCARGRLHSGWALSLSVGGRTEVVYLPARLRKEVAEGLRRREELAALLERITRVDIATLRTGARRYRKRR